MGFNNLKFDQEAVLNQRLFNVIQTCPLKELTLCGTLGIIINVDILKTLFKSLSLTDQKLVKLNILLDPKISKSPSEEELDEIKSEFSSFLTR